MSNVYLLPVITFLTFQLTFISTYIFSVLTGHVLPNFPYISDTATYPPESCYFAQLCNIGSVLMGFLIFIRYKQIDEIFNDNAELNRLIWLYNKISLWFGGLSCAGISIVGNFQATSLRSAHYFGALICFGCGTIYFWIQSFISYMVLPICGTKCYAHLRLIISINCAIFFVSQSVTCLLSYAYFNETNPRQWQYKDGGWGYHIASTISEWIVAYMFCFYVLSFANEFRYVAFMAAQVRLLPENRDAATA